MRTHGTNHFWGLGEGEAEISGGAVVLRRIAEMVGKGLVQVSSFGRNY